MQGFTYRDFISRVLTSASATAMSSFGNVSGNVKAGDPNQVLTATDLEIGRFIVGELTRSYPGHNVIDEETGVIQNNSAYTWVVDPIDGTSNFAAGVPLFGVMLGLLYGETPIAGGIALPAFGTICIAEKGKGAWCGTERIAVSAVPDLRDSLVAYGIDGQPYNPDATKQAGAFVAELVLRIRNLRSSNSAFDSLMVAQGKYGAVLNKTSRIWDNVAPQLVIEEAGGIYTTFDGQPMKYADPTTMAGANFTFCAGAPALHHQLQVIIQSKIGNASFAPAGK